jgi:two-component system chemotaxis sensor kinase CheA
MSDAQLGEVREALQHLAAGALHDTGDLTGLAMAGSAFREAADEAPDGSPAEEALATAAELSDTVILAEGEAAVRGRELLVRCREHFTAETPPAPEATAELVAELCAALERTELPPATAALLGRSEPAPAESGAAAPAAAAEPAEVPRPKADAVNLADEEDAVVYTEFVSESLEHIEAVEVRVLDLEASPHDRAIINDIFRPVHSIKGAAGFLGLTTTNILCHELETLLDQARKGELSVTQDVVNVVLAGIDHLKQLIHNIAEMVTAAKEKAVPPELPDVDVRPVVQAVRTLLETPQPPPSQAEADPGKLGGRLVEQGLVSQEALSQALTEQQRPLGKVLSDMGAVSQQAVEETAAGMKKSKGAAAIKVDTQKLDSLMEMVGELVIAQSQVQQDVNEGAGQNGSQMSLARNVGNMSKITRNLQDLVMSLRMVPLRQTFQRMYRLVRDTTQKTGKEAKLVLSGEDTEIDKTVSEEIADPLVHLLRNAVDHGIQQPEEREAAGKPAEGRIDLRAYHQGGNVVIEVVDDGKGLSQERILEKAVEKGLAQEGKEYSEKEIFDFIMAPGFSTAAQTTDISGRGVGMDVVKRNIEKLGGRVEIRSTLGAGTTFTIRLPLTMAIVDGMVVPIGRQRFVIPTLSIEESVRPTKEMVSTVRGKGEMVMVRDQLIPLLRLNRSFDLGEEEAQPWERLVIIVNAEDRRVGLMVDSLLGQQQVVIKSLGDRLRGIQGVSGGCILGDGRVALILDIAGLVKMADSN